MDLNEREIRIKAFREALRILYSQNRELAIKEFKIRIEELETVNK